MNVMGRCILSGTRGLAKVVSLNRPSKLNAIDGPMVIELRDELKRLSEESLGGSGASTVFVLRGEGRAFSAGGDVEMVREVGLADGDPSAFFRAEYLLNAQLGGYVASEELVQVSLWDGIVMGGGVGLSVHGRYRVATEKTMFAMPEAMIGFFPDVGSSHALAKMPRSSGVYTALTGARLDAADVMYGGLATHYVASDAVEGLVDSLGALELPTAEDVGATLDAASAKLQSPGVLETRADQIERCFDQPTVQAVLAALEKEEADEFVNKAILSLRKASPVSLRIAHGLLKRAKPLSLRECLKMDFRVAYRLCYKRSALYEAFEIDADFHEGVRAALVDKDRNPDWAYKDLDSVPNALVEWHFDELPEKLELY